MSDSLCLSFRFLSPWFHGRGDGGVPEWPPSPLRAFQALVAAAGRGGTLESSGEALRWLESLDAPELVAPAAEPTRGHRLSVPHNATDLTAKHWVKGEHDTGADQRTMKDVRPHRLEGEEPVVHYLWSPPELPRAHVEALVRLAKAVVALGWGTDLVAGFGALISASERERLPFADGARVGFRWAPREDGGQALRVPVAGSLDDLERRHQAFLRRASLEPDAPFNPPPPLSVFASVKYENVDDLGSWAGPMGCVFSLMLPDADAFRAFESATKGAVVAGQMRDVVQRAARNAGWDEETIRRVVLGHGEERGAEHVPAGERRFAFLPLPSIEPRESGEKATFVRRVMVVSSDRDDVTWVRRALVGESLRREGTGAIDVVLDELPSSDRTSARYRKAEHEWTTVTPVVLPGRDDPGGLKKRLAAKPKAEEQKSLLERLARRRDGLVRKALRQVGVPDELVFHAEIEAREHAWLAGVEPAGRFRVAAHLDDWPRLHVRVRWFSASGEPLRVAGPLCIGRGRYSGMGLFANTPP